MSLIILYLAVSDACVPSFKSIFLLVVCKAKQETLHIELYLLNDFTSTVGILMIMLLLAVFNGNYQQF